MVVMPDPGVTIAVAQLGLSVAEPDANRKAAAAAVAEAAVADARLVVLPELSDSGYVFADADEVRSLAAPAANNVTLREWRSLADAYNLTIAGGFCELGADGKLYNSAAIVDKTGTKAVYRKAHLWDTEKKFFTPGDGPPAVVELPFGNVGLMICYDLEFPEWVRLAALSGADLIAVPTNWPAGGSPPPPGERSGEVVSAQAAASNNGVFIAVADRCRTERGVDWVGGSVILRRGGYPLAGPVCADHPAVLTATVNLPLARDKRISDGNDLFKDRRPELYAQLRTSGSRVATASAHWAARFVENGTAAGDFTETLSRIKDWDDWCREWGVTGRRYEALAERAAAEGRDITAGEAWRRAALCWHWGKFVFAEHPDQQREAHEHTIADYRRGAATLTPPAELVAVPYGDATLAAYLRVPAGTERPPAVIMIPGLDSVKEELQATAEYLLRRGLAVIAVDGPGQGEAEYAGMLIEPAYERVTDAVVEYLRGRDDVDAGRIGVFGVSLGGYYAARAAAFTQGLTAVVALAGPYRFDLDWDDLPPQTRATFRLRSGAASEQEARRNAGALTLEEAAGKITIPLLVAHGGKDRLIPAYHAEKLAGEAASAELLLYPDGNHGLTSNAFESRSAMTDWLAARLS